MPRLLGFFLPSGCELHHLVGDFFRFRGDESLTGGCVQCGAEITVQPTLEGVGFAAHDLFDQQRQVLQLTPHFVICGQHCDVVV